MKRAGQMVGMTRDRHRIFLHRLQQGRLGSGAGAVDFIAHQQLRKDRAGQKAKTAFAFLILFQHFRAQDIGWHQIRGELNAARLQSQDLA